ncbi:transcription antitermination factor NusB [Pelotomaculum propionicicum]|uniref:Transcription antitermination protein NusB n=1 Tax=Pelotomaculum propionicicum TaxID=258475 RepID=A0A4Y7RJM2_9FIRM|nr:transcription antitermination factor NusB [Pelotomaculum propionicicum]NLI11996.1 transcription antitermination factor NusB [Peptococcaceae bacterium]TEB08929.1 N utilization substance protein B [Pelotomaculum propionicicum]
MSRRLARERALQVLFQVDVGGADPDTALRQMDEDFGDLTKNSDFIKRLVYGVIENLKPIDRIISNVSKDWSLSRIARVDKNIMRLALFEMLYCDDIPSGVSVNEAVEMGKTFGGKDSGKFINGILGKVMESPEEYTPSKTI